MLIISRNLTELKKYIIDFVLHNIKNSQDLINYLYKNNMIYHLDYNIYYNNKILDKLNDIIDKLDNKYTIIVRDNVVFDCSCCK
jgi:hypothetical protein